jgi:hypothetical protein
MMTASCQMAWPLRTASFAKQDAKRSRRSGTIMLGRTLMAFIRQISSVSCQRVVAWFSRHCSRVTPTGLSSHDATSVGQRLIVSDIPINKEIEMYVDHYFNPTDARALLDRMRKVGEPSRMKSPPRRNRSTQNAFRVQ